MMYNLIYNEIGIVAVNVVNPNSLGIFWDSVLQMTGPWFITISSR